MKEVRSKLEQYDWSKTGDLKPDELAQMLKDNAQTREPTQEVWPAPCSAGWPSMAAPWVRCSTTTPATPPTPPRRAERTGSGPEWGPCPFAISPDPAPCSAERITRQGRAVDPAPCFAFC